VKALKYSDAGVNIDRGNRVVDRIKEMVRTTFSPLVLSDLGGFSGFFQLPKGMKDPVLTASTDGVGTKLKVAFLADKHDTVGIDLVAMCVNDLIVTGAKPLFFLDYLATGRIDEDKIESIVEGVVKGCRDAGCALLGGETAEMPGFYSHGEYDLAGFAVGVVERSGIIDGSDVAPGDVVLGIPSSGLHSNGYSLVRKVLFEKKELSINDPLTEGMSVGEELLKPTRIYVRAVDALIAEGISVKAMAHITGGGLIENPVRVLPEGLRMLLDASQWDIHPIFRILMEWGGIPVDEMFRTFNMGIGMVVVLPEKEKQEALNALDKAGFPSKLIGYIERGEKEVEIEWSCCV
jgi:phosphoribosylformylglycinamidine cyclo-ligase